MSNMYKYILVGVVCLLIGAAGTALAMHTGSGEVRLVAQRHDDGRVEIGLQERQADGAWGERRLPDARFLSAEAESGRWLVSSPLDVGAGRWSDGALACIVGHGQPGDAFWQPAGETVELAAEDLKMNLRFVSGETPEEQAALVRECVSDGAQVIATTLAGPEALTPAIAEARKAGVQVASFNSGGEYSSAAGSALHIGLADRAGGERAGHAFNTNGVTGAVLCVIHELENQGLEDRCDGLESSYGGEVERLRVGDTGTSDIAGSQAAIAQRLAEGGVAGILTLNGNLLDAAVAARGDAKVEVASFGRSPRMWSQIRSREVMFVIYDQPQIQAYLTAATLAFLGYSSRYGDTSSILGGAQILIEPILVDYEYVAGWRSRQRAGD